MKRSAFLRTLKSAVVEYCIFCNIFATRPTAGTRQEKQLETRWRAASAWHRREKEAAFRSDNNATQIVQV